MRLLAPVAKADEVRPLADAGADELFCGIYPEAWYSRWGRGAWPNRRGPGPANVSSKDEIAALVAAGIGAHRDGDLPVYVALNAMYHTDEQQDVLLAVARDCRDAGVAAFIVTDPALLIALRDEVPEVPRFASTVAVALNADAVRLLHDDLGCSRIILSRHLDLREIAELKSAVPDIDVEAFLLNDDCWFEEGFCSTTHTMTGFGVYCMTPWELQVERDGHGPIEAPQERAQWDFLVDEHRAYLHHLGTRGHGGGSLQIPLGPCGLCAIPELIAAGVHSAKIVGREASAYRKLRSVQAARRVRDVAMRDGPLAAKREAITLRDDAEGCAAGYSCYYRSARDRSLLPMPTRPRGPRR